MMIKKAWLDAHPDFDLDTERAEAKKVADAMKRRVGLLPAIHGDIKTCPQFPWNALKQIHRISKRTLTRLLAEQILLFLHLEQILNNGGEYTGNEKFEYLKSQGYDYYCNVDSNKYFVQMTDEYFRMGRRNVDG